MMFESIYKKFPPWFHEETDPVWFYRRHTWLNVFAFTLADCVWRMSKFRTQTRLSNAKSGQVFLGSLLLGFSIVGLRESIVNPVIMHYVEEPSNGERRKIYQLERTLLKDGSSRLHVAKLTNGLHRENDLTSNNRVFSSGLAASPLFVAILARSRNVFMVLPISFAIFAGTQISFNQAFVVKNRVYANNYRSRRLTTELLEAQFEKEDGTKKPIQTVLAELEVEHLQDEVIQVQKDLSIVRRALAASGGNK